MSYLLIRVFRYLLFIRMEGPFFVEVESETGEAAWEKVQLKNDRRFPTQTRFSKGGLSSG
jgi:hypothetical protein